MTLSRRATLAMLAGSCLASPRLAVAQADRLRLVVGTQDTALQETVNASGVLAGLPFELQWATLPGPAAQLSGLYSKALDVGLMGDTSLIIEQARARVEWTEETAPLQIVAGWRNPDPAFPPIVTAVRSSANIATLAVLRGKRWAFNFGGYNYLQYLASRIRAGLRPEDIQPVQLVDGNAAAAAFNSGRTDVYSGGLGPVKPGIDKGEARILIRSDELEIPALTVFTARGEVIRDERKAAALADLLGRIRQHWDWVAANQPSVEAIFREKLKQTPERAAYSAPSHNSRFVALDDALIRREQRLAEILAESGDIPRRIDVSVEFSRRFNAVTGPTT
ncbi:type 2 periplasmic-binding domain-containing protein [Paracraurococcus lichenis]|uniref:ABC transporter substrate-binding protein n=1 Tax=Paracraurococcus lichenis TaxID=3064888 RepID=A0ABT9E5K0_9PROT|nr:hypothetical protein [Paracraurococcus sp. LOR1-02]MDO9711448.1 hypothetical protein [Paracraurococcus sp. LOR1-02]